MEKQICKFCKEEIPINYAKCPECHSVLLEQGEKNCSFCAGVIKKDALICKHCKKSLDEKVEVKTNTFKKKKKEKMVKKSVEGKKTLSYILFSFKGRICRKTFFKYELRMFLLIVLAGVLSALIIPILLKTYNKQDISLTFILVSIPAIIVVSWSGVALTIKRYHDFNISGWISVLIPFLISLAYMILLYIMFLNGTNKSSNNLLGDIIALIIFIIGVFHKGDEGENKYGKNPLE